MSNHISHSYLHKILRMMLLPVIFLQLLSCKKIQTTSPVRKNIEEAVFANGFTTYENQYNISANADGTLHGLLIKEGDSVRLKQIVAVINSDAQKGQVQQSRYELDNALINQQKNSDQLEELHQQVLQASAQLEQDKKNYERYKDLHSTNSVSQSDYENATLQYTSSLHNLAIQQKKYGEMQTSLNLNANTSQAQLSVQKALLNNYNVQADSAGIVISVAKKNGEILRTGDNITVIGSGKYIIKLYVSEDDIIKVKLGQKMAIHLNTYADTSFPATVTKIYPGFDNDQQSYTIEAHFDVLPQHLYSGTQLQANIITGEKNNALVIPANYLLKNNQVQLKDNSYRTITVGNKDNQWVEVIAGLTEKDIIKAPKN